jgi:flagellar biosynthesis chaperone FliJ
MIEKIKKDIYFYRTMLIPRLKSKGDAGYKSDQIAKHLERFIDNVEKVIYPQQEIKEQDATPENAAEIFKA